MVLPVDLGHDVEAREFEELQIQLNHWINNDEIIGGSVFIIALLGKPFPAICSIDLLSTTMKGEMDFALGCTIVFHTCIGIINISIPVQSIIHKYIGIKHRLLVKLLKHPFAPPISDSFSHSSKVSL